MDFLRTLRHALTGGAARVQVQLPLAVRRGEMIPVTIQAVARASARVGAVYLLVRATEVARINTTGAHRVTYETRIAIAGAQQLEEGQSYTWQGQLPMPQGGNPTFHGQMIHHTWEIQAGLDMRGRDPGSGWQPIEVS